MLKTSQSSHQSLSDPFNSPDMEDPQSPTMSTQTPDCTITEPDKESEEDNTILSPDPNLQVQGNKILISIRKRMRRFLGAPTESSVLHKSMQDLSLDSAGYEARKSSSTGNGMQNIASKSTRDSYITNDVPDDIQSIKREYEEALITLTSLSDGEIRAVRTSWMMLKTHIEKIGVIVFLGLFEEHSDFRDAFARFRGKQLREITRDPALQAHGLRVLNIVDKLVSRLQKVETIQDFILSLGCRHCKYVPSIKLIPCVGEQLLEAFHPVLEEQGVWTKDTETGWTILLDFLTKAMRYGLARTPQNLVA
ncbi:Globin X [Fasciola gigantica]|uniref:Globin X n=1 Tax=Fasciola gigantica TaxID=46835 RepID=A0A504YMW5_FASGI|nr:Globin X [Fasciola gigantica]